MHNSTEFLFYQQVEGIRMRSYAAYVTDVRSAESEMRGADEQGMGTGKSIEMLPHIC